MMRLGVIASPRSLIAYKGRNTSLGGAITEISLRARVSVFVRGATKIIRVRIGAPCRELGGIANGGNTRDTTIRRRRSRWITAHLQIRKS